MRAGAGAGAAAGCGVGCACAGAGDGVSVGSTAMGVGAATGAGVCAAGGEGEGAGAGCAGRTACCITWGPVAPWTATVERRRLGCGQPSGCCVGPRTRGGFAALACGGRTAACCGRGATLPRCPWGCVTNGMPKLSVDDVWRSEIPARALNSWNRSSRRMLASNVDSGRPSLLARARASTSGIHTPGTPGAWCMPWGEIRGTVRCDASVGEGWFRCSGCLVGATPSAVSSAVPLTKSVSRRRRTVQRPPLGLSQMWE